MSFIDNIKYAFQTDPEYKKKVLIYGGVIVGLILILIMIFALSSAFGGSDEVQDQSKIEGLEDTLIDYKDYSKLEKINDNKVSVFSDKVGFYNDKPIFLNEKGEFVIDDKKESTFILPSSFYQVDDHMIINSSDGVYKYKDSLEKYPDRIITVTANNKTTYTDFYFLSKEESGAIGFYSASNIDLTSGVEKITEFFILENQTLEIKIIGDEPYLFVEESEVTDKSIYVLSYDEERDELDTLQQFNNVISSVYLDKKLLITVTENSASVSLDTYVVDFSSNLEGEISLLDLTAILDVYGIEGNIHADKCVPVVGDSKVICAVKKEAKATIDDDYRDILLEYNYFDESQKVLHPGVVFMIQKLYLDANNNLYILNQDDDKIYKFTD